MIELTLQDKIEAKTDAYIGDINSGLVDVRRCISEAEVDLRSPRKNRSFVDNLDILIPILDNADRYADRSSITSYVNIEHLRLVISEAEEEATQLCCRWLGINSDCSPIHERVWWFIDRCARHTPVTGSTFSFTTCSDVVGIAYTDDRSIVDVYSGEVTLVRERTDKELPLERLVRRVAFGSVRYSYGVNVKNAEVEEAIRTWLSANSDRYNTQL